MAMATPETIQRTHPRYQTHFDATLESGYVRAEGTVLSLSEEGLFIGTALQLPPGTRVTTTFRVPELGRLRIAGIVSYRASMREHEGLGIRLLATAASRQAMEAVQVWCESYRPGC